MPQSGAFRADLSVEVHGDAVVDGDHIVQLRDGLRRVYIFQRLHHKAGILVRPIIEGLRAKHDPRDALAPLDGLSPVRQLSCLVQLIIGVTAQLRVHAQVPDVRLRQPGADHVRHSSDTQLERGAVHDVRNDQVGDFDILLRGLCNGKLGERLMGALHHIVHLGNVDALIKSAENTGQVFVDLQDDDIRRFQNAPGNAAGTGEVEVAVFVHGRHAHHGHIDRQKVPVIGRHIAEDHGNIVAQAPVAQLSLIAGAVPAVVDKVFPVRVTFHGPDGTKQQVAPDLDICQFLFPFRQGRIQQGGKAHIGCVVHPIPTFDGLHSLLGRAQLGTVFGHKIHMLLPLLPDSLSACAEGLQIQRSHLLRDGFRHDALPVDLRHAQHVAHGAEQDHVHAPGIAQPNGDLTGV